ncbi:MAG: FtsQ-type POTRA domain-containing protein [Clostridia bacterium]|nr:FtsQ-type POTRA domain-containing protein [Clostridia bacterium]
MQKKKLTSAEKYKRKMLRRRIIASSILGLIVVLCVCLFTPIFGVSETTVEGNSALTAEEIISTSGIHKGQNIFRMNTKKSEKKLESLPYVDDAKIVKKFPAKIKIVIDESTEDIIIDTPNEFIVTTIDGRVLYKTTDVTEVPVPIVQGIAVTDAEPSKKIKASDEETKATNIEYIKCFFGSDYWSEIDVFDVSDPANFMMVMRSGMRVTFGPIDTIESLQRKIQMMDAIIAQVKPTERSYLDLTTDKGYFGEYTEDEYENIKQLREDGDLIKKLTEDEPEEVEEGESENSESEEESTAENEE